MLNKYKNMEIDKSTLCEELGEDLYNVAVENPVIVTANNVIDAIVRYTDGDVTKEEFVDWVNVIWFTELFEYAEEEEDSIASVMTLLETLDEAEEGFSKEEFAIMIEALKKNEICEL